jgi:hypothetical protein
MLRLIFFERALADRLSSKWHDGTGATIPWLSWDRGYLESVATTHNFAFELSRITAPGVTNIA